MGAFTRAFGRCFVLLTDANSFRRFGGRDMEAVKVVFLRHGESEWNKLNLFCGWHDVDLSEKGKSDAATISAGALLKNDLKFDVAFTSALKRAQQSLGIILNALECSSIPVHSHWRLNERHYGDLTGLNKRQMAEKYGEEQVQIWRRSFNVPPPQMNDSSPYYAPIRSNPNFADIPADEFPDSETLESVMHRVIPYWESDVVAQIKSGKRVLIVAHGTIIRAIVKHIEVTSVPWNVELCERQKHREGTSKATVMEIKKRENNYNNHYWELFTGESDLWNSFDCFLGISDEKISTINIPNSIPCVYNFNISTMQPIGPMEFLADKKYLQDQIRKTASIGN